MVRHDCPLFSLLPSRVVVEGKRAATEAVEVKGMNKNYAQGRRFEWKVKKELEAEFYIVVRSAGSKGPFDLVALKSYEPAILIQCKCVKTEAQARALHDAFVANPTLYRDHNYRQQLRVYIKAGRKTFVSEL